MFYFFSVSHSNKYMDCDTMVWIEWRVNTSHRLTIIYLSILFVPFLLLSHLLIHSFHDSPCLLSPFPCSTLFAYSPVFSTISHSVVDSQSLLLQIFLFKTLITDKNVFNRDGSMWRSSKRCWKSFLERTGDFSNESLFYSLSICLGLKRPKMMLSSITRPFSLKQGMDRFSLAV